MLFAGLFKLLVVIFVIQGNCQGWPRARWSLRNGEPGEKGDPSAGSTLTDTHRPAGSEGSGQSQGLGAGSIDSLRHHEGVSQGQDHCTASSRARDEHTYKHSWGRTGSPGQYWNGIPGPWARVRARPGEAGQGHSSLLVPDSIKIRISDQQNNLLFFWECSSEINTVTPFD